MRACERARHRRSATDCASCIGANEPLLIAGVGTYALEMLEDQPALDVIVVPVGLGSGACGCCIVRTGVQPCDR